MGNALLIAEHLHGKFPKTTLNGLTAAKQAAQLAGGKALAVVLADKVDALAADLAGYGVDVVAVEAPAFAHYLADTYTAAIAEIAKQKDVEVVVAAATAVGKDLAPRVAARLGAAMAAEVTGLVDAKTVQRPLYAGNAIATVAMEGSPRVISVRTTAFDAAEKGGSGNVEKLALSPSSSGMSFVDFAETKSDRPVLTEARIVCSGGRGLKNGENFTTYLEPLCDALGAAMGARREVV
jgi:electron transfer flavoprotein alpha subunit